MQPDPLDYPVRVCLGRCGYDASFQPPEVHRCPSCGAIVGAVPAALVDEFRDRGPGGHGAA